MDELTLRILLVSIVGVGAAVGALAARRGRSLRRRRFVPDGIDAGLHLFTSAACASCERARSTLDESGHPYEEHSFERHEAVLRANRIERVPAVAYVPEDGDAAWLAEGVPSLRTLDRWLSP